MRLAFLSLTVPALSALVGLVASACDSVKADVETTVVAGVGDDGRMWFEPVEMTVKAGQIVKFIIENDDGQDHEFESDEAGIEEILVPPGRTREAVWRAPKKAGTYPIYCDLPGHRESGMEMTVTVEE